VTKLFAKNNDVKISKKLVSPAALAGSSRTPFQECLFTLRDQLLEEIKYANFAIVSKNKIQKRKKNPENEPILTLKDAEFALRKFMRFYKKHVMRLKVEFRYSSDDSDLEEVGEHPRLPNGINKGMTGQADLYEMERQSRPSHILKKEVDTHRF